MPDLNLLGNFINKHMRNWKTVNVIGEKPSYYLCKETNPNWYAKVFIKNGLYTFTFGERDTDENIDPKRYSWVKRGWKSADTAKKVCLEYIFRKSLGLDVIENEN